MLHTKRFLGAALLASLLLNSCGDKFLDQAPTDRLTEASFYKTETDAIQATNAAYGVLTQQGLYNASLWGFGDVMADNSETGGGGGGDGAEYVQLDNYTIAPTNPLIFEHWSACYLGIGRANLVLERVPGISMTESIRKRCLGEAQFLRALYYFHLVRIYGDVPLILTPPKSAAEALIARSPQEEVYTQIVKDLNDAATNLAAFEKYTGDDAGRATKWSAVGLLAKVQLTRGKMTEAAAAARQVINSGKFQLWSDYGNNFKVATENGQESIFEVQFKSSVTTWNDYGVGFKGNEFFAPRGQGLTPNSGYGFNVPMLEFAQGYETGDTRRAVTIWRPGDAYPAGTTAGTAQPNSLPGSPNGLNVKKWFVGRANNCCHDSELNIPVLRLAEMHLILAEALGATTEGFENLNIVRRRAFGDTTHDLTPANTPDFKAAVLRERRYELAFEDDRWYDLKRTNTLVSTMRARGKNIQEFNTLLPIPQSERDINPKLTQNTGY
ncbi:RagB/SusD family nutrient uptake outer membrane protein [Hymenobacter jeollabukensis]|uniref:RagB/SusD family nutrient uptake outer membrane protein n=1 Tax=Hymenobacter jeollabukensis TaxID=2025313 RepID=A0A5R8WYC4_9BACT|nr:RagB/SusD family nutrient uptake outer membrane protein [Hymenobacter jeollabukensis]TLM97135.1 RagB/SusD family nutrient uptake outer membrane protein [Hymenobacter jeollabukensis]